MTKKKLLVLTSGGDAPGMNAAIRAVVRAGHYYDFDVFGCRQGYTGLIQHDIIPLGPESVANCIQRGGTLLKTGRCLAFLEESSRAACRTYLQQENIQHLIVIGGDGSFQGAALLSAQNGPNVIGIPATIDNDIPGTEYSIGYDTARNTALHAIDNIRDTASSHEHSFLIEVMGRESGFLAVDVAIAGGAEYILTPEFPIEISDLANAIASPKRNKTSLIMIVAEANEPGRSMRIAEELNQLTQKTFRVCILGHTQRGGTPTAIDRLLASQMGEYAVQLLKNGETQKMVGWQHHQLYAANFPTKENRRRFITDPNLIQLSSILAI